MHLEVLPSPWQRNHSQNLQKPAGSILRAEKDLKRRGMNSLVWENAYPDETLFYHDSVLTLSESTATLKLEQDTEIHLSENTLVTIEPQTQNSLAEIRLKFSRGDLRAKNSSGLAKIETERWTLDLSKDSEIALRQQGNKNFEVEVVKGTLDFQQDNQSKSFSENQVLSIKNNQILRTAQIASDIQFQGPSFERVYTNHSISQVPIAWLGSAERIEISDNNNGQVLEKSISDLKKTDLALEPGRYTLRLINKNKVSEIKAIEIWKAPTLHLLSPSPRDRLKTNQEISLIWSSISEAVSYKVITTNTKNGKSNEHSVRENSLQLKWNDEEDVQWRVIGIDANGFEIPSSYRGQFFLRHEPFAAPKLKSPEIRIPASDSEVQKKKVKKPGSAFYHIWSLLISSAQANPSSSDYEAVFAWDAIEGADQYTIEISDSRDFRNPRVSQVVRKTKFIWSQFSLGTYYWRVAAGSSKGRMGLFSEAAKVNLTNLPSTSSTTADGVLIRKKERLERNREAINTDDQNIIQNAPKPVFNQDEIFKKDVELISEENRNLKETYLLEWTPLATSWTLNGEDDLKVNLSGNTTGSGHLQTEQIISSEKSYFVDVFYAQYKWKAKDISNYPLQEDQGQTDVRLQILFGNNKSGVLRGGLIQTVPVVERKDLEKIQIKNLLTLGPSAYFSWKESGRWRGGNTLSVLAGSSVFAVTNQNHLRYQFYQGEGTGLSVGLRLQVDGIFHQRSFSTGWGAGLSLGLDSF